jgi:hypothetical protein
LALIKHANDAPTINILDDDNDNDDKLQMALVLGVELKNGPAHRIHIGSLLCRAGGGTLH